VDGQERQRKRAQAFSKRISAITLIPLMFSFGNLSLEKSGAP
jgi:hypothetical protein